MNIMTKQVFLSNKELKIMKEDAFPIWSMLTGWSNFFHFFHMVCTKQDTFPAVRNFIETIMPILLYFKFTVYHELIRSFGDNTFVRLYSTLVYNFVTLDFIGAKYVALFMFSFGLLFTFYLIYYYRNREKFIVHHTPSVFCFIIQEISPLFGAYSSSELQLIIVQVIKKETNIFPLVIAILSWMIFTFYTFVGSLFRKSATSRDSICHSFWRHLHYFWLYILTCSAQQAWVLIFIYNNGIVIVLYINLFLSFSMFAWFTTLPYFSASVNIFALNITGHTWSIIIVSLFYYHFKFNAFVCLMIMMFVFLGWRIFFGKTVFNILCKIYDKRYKIADEVCMDVDNRIQVPKFRPHKLMQMVHYMFMVGFSELNELLIAIIDEEIDDNLTIECAKCLNIIGTIPHRIREKLFHVDVRKLSLASKPFLYELQYEMNKLQVNEDDVHNLTYLLEEEKQMTKIYLYAFVNSLCEMHYDDSKFNTLLNFAMRSHRFKKMSEYAIEGNPRSKELMNIYRDYLTKYSGDFCRCRQLLVQNDQTKFTLLTDPSRNGITNFKIKNPSKEKQNFDEMYSQSLSQQKALDNISLYPDTFAKWIVVVMAIYMMLPIVSVSTISSVTNFYSYDYFHQTHSPLYMKISLAITDLDNFYKYFGEEFIENSTISKNLKDVYFADVVQFLGKYMCTIDKKPIIDVLRPTNINYMKIFYKMMALKEMTSTNEDFNFRNLRYIHYFIDSFNESIQPIVIRYIRCSNYFREGPHVTWLYIMFSLIIVLYVIMAIFNVFLTKKYLNKIISVFNGIETATLEEFRSNLFIQINNVRVQSGIHRFSVDNEGALSLEELEVDDKFETFQGDDYQELIEKSVNAKVEIKFYDPANLTTYLIYTLILILFRFMMVGLIEYSYRKGKIKFVNEAIGLQKQVCAGSDLLIQMAALIANQTRVRDYMSIVPRKSWLDPSLNYPEKYYKLFDEWNEFISQNRSFKFNDVKYFIKDIAERLVEQIEEAYEEKNVRIDKSELGYIDLAFWFLNDCTVFIFLGISFRYIMNMKYILINAKHLVLVLHSKYSSTQANMINSLTPEIKTNQPIDLDNLSQIIVTQMRDPVVFFDTNWKITGGNQQTAADLGYSSLNSKDLSVIFEPSTNPELYSFIKSMFSPVGVITKKTFTLFATTQSGAKIEYFAVLIPITFKGFLTHFAMLMRNMTEINNMKKDLEQAKTSSIALLKMLMPDELIPKFIDGSIQNFFEVKNTVIFAATIKTKIGYFRGDMRLQDNDLTEVSMSIMDSVFKQCKNVTRIRTFNGIFVYIAGITEEKTQKENLENMIEFIRLASDGINKAFNHLQVLTGVMRFAGKSYGFMSGIKRCILDFCSEPMIEAFDLIDVVPPEKIMITKDEYEALEKKGNFVGFIPPRSIGDLELFINRIPL